MRKIEKMLITLTVLCTLSLNGCSGQKESSLMETTPVLTEAPTTAPTEPPASTPTAAPTEEPATAPTEAPAVELILPLSENTSGKVLIQAISMSLSYPYNSYAITSSNGETVVLDPTSIIPQKFMELNPVAIISSHSHADHTDPAYVKKYPDSKVVLYTEEDFSTRDFHITTVKSTHNEGGTFDNVIIILEVDGLRIAHMGDIGQKELTAEQKEKLGKIDIAFMQFENSYSGISLKNEIGFHLIEQLNPSIVIPTHFTSLTLPVLEEKYGTFVEYSNFMTIGKEDLPEDTMNVYRILNKYKFR